MIDDDENRADEYRSNKRPFRQVQRASPGRQSAVNCHFEVVSAVIGRSSGLAGRENSHTSAQVATSSRRAFYARWTATWTAFWPSTKRLPGSSSRW
jgi:hypothetical protein